MSGKISMNHGTPIIIPKLTFKNNGLAASSFTPASNDNSDSDSEFKKNITIESKSQFHSQEKMKLRINLAPTLQKASQSSINESPGKESNEAKFEYIDNDLDEFCESPMKQLGDFGPHSYGAIPKSPSRNHRSEISSLYNSQVYINPFSKNREGRTNRGEGNESDRDSPSPLHRVCNTDRVMRNEFHHDFSKLTSIQKYGSEPYNESRKNLPKTSVRSFKNYLENEKIIEGILDFLNAPELLSVKSVTKVVMSSNLSKKFKAALRHSLLGGLDKPQQRKFWKHFVDFETIKQNNPLSFINIFFKKNTYLREINKDIDRTLQDEAFFQREEGKNALFRVLVVLSNSIQEVGYIQGLNSIVGTYLLYLREEDTYWMMVYLLKKRGLKNLISHDFPLVNQWNYQLKCFMHQYIPEIYQHIIAKGQTIEYFSTPWFLTLYTHYFRIPIVMKFWNFYLVKGEKIFLKLAITILKFFTKDILERDIDEIGEFLKQSLWELSNEGPLLEEALSVKITRRLLEQLKKIYENGSPDPTRLILVKNDDAKLEFQEKPNEPALTEELSGSQKSVKESSFEIIERKQSSEGKLNDEHQKRSSTLSDEESVVPEDPSIDTDQPSPHLVPRNKTIKMLHSLVLQLDRIPNSEQHPKKDQFEKYFPLSARNYEELESLKNPATVRTSNYIDTKVLDDENADQILNIENFQNNLENMLREKSTSRPGEQTGKQRNENGQPVVETPSTISSQEMQSNAQQKPLLKISEQSFCQPSSDINVESVNTSSKDNDTGTSDKQPEVEEEERRIEEDWGSLGSFQKSHIECSVKKRSRKNTGMHTRLNSYSGISVLSFDFKPNRLSNLSNASSPKSVLTTKSHGKANRIDDNDSNYSFKSPLSAKYVTNQNN